MELSRTALELNRLQGRSTELRNLENSVKTAVLGQESEPKDKKTSKPREQQLGTPAKNVASGNSGPTKKCSKCNQAKTLDRFPPHPDTRDGLAAWCKDCRAVLRKRRNETNFEARLKHHFAARMASQVNVPSAVRLVADMEDILGYKMADLVASLEQDLQEREGISLAEAFKRGYHVDHITPLSSFKAESVHDEEFRKCWAIDNLRAIPAIDNLKKGAEDIYGD